MSSQNLFCFILINHGFLYIFVSGNKYFFPEKLIESMKQWHLFCLLPLMAACDSGHSGFGELISVDLRQGIDHPSMLNLQDEVESVEYIPLETTDDPASLLDGVSEYALTSKYIYVSPVKEQRIVQFDRKGHFIKTLIPFGQGPGEFSNFLAGIQADEENNRLYLC